MSYLLRVVPKKAVWIKYELGFPDWVTKGDIPADPLFDYKTTENKVSVFLTANDKQEITRIATAYYAWRYERFNEDFEYILIDKRIVDKLNIELQIERALLPDSTVNEVHFDMVNMSGKNFCKIIDEVYKDGLKCDVIQRNEIKTSLSNGIKNGTISNKRMKKPLKEILIKEGYIK